MLFFVVGCFSILQGIAFLANDDYFVADELLFGDLSLWGTLYLILGAIQLLAAFLIWRGSVDRSAARHHARRAERRRTRCCRSAHIRSGRSSSSCSTG